MGAYKINVVPRRYKINLVSGLSGSESFLFLHAPAYPCRISFVHLFNLWFIYLQFRE